jgi:hypothetical protein
MVTGALGEPQWRRARKALKDSEAHEPKRKRSDSVSYYLLQNVSRRRSQVVRQGSAKAPFGSSNLPVAFKGPK